MSSRPVRWGFAALVAAALLPSGARAETIIDLVNNTSGSAPGAQFYQTQQQPTGTGVIDPFVRIQMHGTESGYNTDGNKFQFDEKAGIWTHALPLNSLQTVTMNGKSYYQFLLDINETDTAAGRLLSLNEVQIYLGKDGNYDKNTNPFTSDVGFGTAGALSTKVFDLDSGGVDRTVELDYGLNSGSGSGDMYMYVEKSLFDAAFHRRGTGTCTCTRRSATRTAVTPGSRNGPRRPGRTTRRSRTAFRPLRAWCSPAWALAACSSAVSASAARPRKRK